MALSCRRVVYSIASDNRLCLVVADVTGRTICSLKDETR